MKARDGWTDLESWLLELHTQKNDPRYQDAATLLRQQREALIELIDRCCEVMVCMSDPQADAYDGNTTRAVWAQTVNKLRHTYLKE